MATRRDNRAQQTATKVCSSSARNHKNTINNWIKKNAKWDRVVNLLTDPRRLGLIAGLFLGLEVILNILVIENVRYTEIDWRAYMQEVEGFVNGTMDYSKLRGDTGPLVYPAGFVYVFTILYYATSRGINVKLGQYIFAALYVTLLALVFRIYGKTKTVPPYVLILIFCTSYRIHSIFVLRLFNDPIAMVLLFASINAFVDNHWYLGSVLYSLAVSVKMNILLFSPALLIAYLANLGLSATIVHLTICAGIQGLLALPFLIANPYTYLRAAFDFGRVFDFRWTVNWRFLPESVFVNPTFHISLLILHLAAIFYFLPTWITYMKSYARIRYVEKDLKSQLRPEEMVDTSTLARLFVLPLFAANFIGIAFSRSLHYQFYVWYYHTLPYIAWHANYTNLTRIVVLGLIELCWNTYPSTVYSSAVLHLCHLILLYGLNQNRIKPTTASKQS